MTLADHGLAIGLRDLGIGCEHRVVGAESHGATFVGDLPLVVHEVDHWVARRRVELC